MKRPIAILGILSVTLGTMFEFVTTAIYQWAPSFAEDFGPLFNVAVGTNVLGTLAWWVGAVMIGVAAMMSDRPANSSPKS